MACLRCGTDDSTETLHRSPAECARSLRSWVLRFEATTRIAAEMDEVGRRQVEEWATATQQLRSRVIEFAGIPARSASNA